jgi:hypothetical protein
MIIIKTLFPGTYTITIVNTSCIIFLCCAVDKPVLRYYTQDHVRYHYDIIITPCVSACDTPCNFIKAPITGINRTAVIHTVLVYTHTHTHKYIYIGAYSICHIIILYRWRVVLYNNIIIWCYACNVICE